jgi:hypothetical protein
VSIGAIRTEYIIGFIFGVIGVAVGIFLILYQFFMKGYIVDFSPADPYSIFVGLAAFGVVSLAAGVMVIYYTYTIFIPLKENNFKSTRACPYCGAILKEVADVCEKCKQQLDALDIKN